MMFWGADPLLLTGIAGVSLAAALTFKRRVAQAYPTEIDEAIERMRKGERGVRVHVGGCARDARLLNRFNSVVAEIESGQFDWAAASKRDAAMFDMLRQQDEPSAEQDTYMAVVDIDRFGSIRQSIGYKLANAILAELAERIGTLVENAELGRIGRANIEFAFRAGSFGDAQAKLLGIIDQLERRIEVDGFTLDLSVVIGFAHAGTESIRDELIDHAAAALAAGRRERVKVCFADKAVRSAQGVADLELMRMLPKAMQAGEIALHYQPKLDSRNNSFPAAEALLRWHHPERGLIQTDRLIALAEETGAIRDITDWVLSRAVADQARIAADGNDIEIYVNISGQLLSDSDFAQRALSLTAPARGKIGFEITETAVIGDPDAALNNLHAFVDAGIKIAIDDYGSGLSSLAYLKQLPANELKIDRMFVSGLTDSHRDPLLVRSSIDLAHALEMEVTAEGVDDPMALCLLRVMGCDLLQGYHISKPLPLSELIDFLNDSAHAERLSAATFDVSAPVSAQRA